MINCLKGTLESISSLHYLSDLQINSAQTMTEKVKKFYQKIVTYHIPYYYSDKILKGTVVNHSIKRSTTNECVVVVH